LKGTGDTVVEEANVVWNLVYASKENLVWVEESWESGTKRQQ